MEVKDTGKAYRRILGQFGKLTFRILSLFVVIFNIFSYAQLRVLKAFSYYRPIFIRPIENDYRLCSISGYLYHLRVIE